MNIEIVMPSGSVAVVTADTVKPWVLNELGASAVLDFEATINSGVPYVLAYGLGGLAVFAPTN